MSNRLTSKLGTIYCNNCGHPELIYDIDYLQNANSDDIIEYRHFKYIAGDGPLESEALICHNCGEFIFDAITKEWKRLQKVREWDAKDNE